MSKKKLLEESTIRRFGGLAGIKPATTSNFLGEMYDDDTAYQREEEEEGMEVEDDLELELPPEEVEIEDEEEIAVEPESGGEEALVMSLLDKVKEWAASKGVEMEVDGEAEEEVIDMEDDLELELPPEEVEDVSLDMDIEGEEGLEEMIGSILAEEDQEDLTDEKDLTDEEDEDGKKNETIQVLDDEKVIQEVTRRVKQRLARIAKSRKK